MIIEYCDKDVNHASIDANACLGLASETDYRLDGCQRSRHMVCMQVPECSDEKSPQLEISNPPARNRSYIRPDKALLISSFMHT